MTKIVLKKDILHAQEHTNSHREAARFLDLTFSTYKKYAKLYELYDNEHKNQAGKNIPKLKKVGSFGLNDIMEGKHPKYNRTVLKKRLVRAGYLEQKCRYCGYNKVNQSRGFGPFMLDYLDGDAENLAHENLAMICYNCYYNLTGIYKFTDAGLAAKTDRPVAYQDDTVEVLGETELEDFRGSLFDSLDDD